MNTRFLLKYGKNNSHYNLDDLVNSSDWFSAYHVTKHPELTDKHLDILSKHHNPDVHTSLLDNNNLKPQHLHNIIDNSTPSNVGLVCTHPACDDTHIDRMVESNYRYVRSCIAEHEKIKPHHIDRLISNDFDDNVIMGSLAKNSNLLDRHIMMFTKHPDVYVRRKLALYANLTSNHIDQMKDDRDMSVLRYLSNKNNITDEQKKYIGRRMYE